MKKKPAALCYVVVAASGEYEDYSDRNLSVFADKETAMAWAAEASAYLNTRRERYQTLMRDSLDDATSPDDHLRLWNRAKRILARHPFDPECDDIDTGYRVQELPFIGLPGVPETPETRKEPQ